MVQTYQGYFQEGRFVSPQSDTIPDYTEVYVVVTNKIIPKAQTKLQEQRRVFEEFAETVSNAEPLGEDFDNIINQGIKIRGDLHI